jgi:hypothetical protein
VSAIRSLTTILGTNHYSNFILELKYMTLVAVKKDTTKKKKLVAVFDDGRKIKFGSATSMTYAEGATKQKQEAYLKRHRVNEDWNKRSAGALSRWVLWSAPSISQGIKEYNRRVK